MFLGITTLGHDASVAVIEGDQILFAAHAERYSRVKNDGMVERELISDALQGERPEAIYYYERPWLKAARQARAGQWSALRSTPSLKSHLHDLGLSNIPVRMTSHHRSHAAGGYYTSGFDDAAVIVCDAIGEFQTVTIWHGHGDDLKCLYEQRYPDSLGLFYSAFTQRIGFKPNEEEYIMMGMAALGQPIYRDLIEADFIDRSGEFEGLPHSRGRFRLRSNMHRGIRNWRPELTDVASIAASVQAITEDVMRDLAVAAWLLTGSKNCVLMGGVALNCVANTVVARNTPFEHFWIMPNPGDAGSAIGAVAAHRGRLGFTTAYLGHDIRRTLDQGGAIQALNRGNAIAVAHGRAEFGPRALGNRSLLADPRGPDAKDRVNCIKKREAFRPFAPVIMAEHAGEYFDMPMASTPYMQYTAPVRRPDLYPAISHYDGTARVQTLTRAQNPAIYDLLSEWYDRTGCPMLLNTSLNIKGEPLCNTWDDARRFSDLYGVPLF